MRPHYKRDYEGAKAVFLAEQQYSADFKAKLTPKKLSANAYIQ